MSLVSPVTVGIVHRLLRCLVKEPHRRRLDAITAGGGGAAPTG